MRIQRFIEVTTKPPKAMKDKHTPGPWAFEQPSRVSFEAGNQSFGIYSGTELKPNWIAEIHFAKNFGIDDAKDELYANAELIAQAPTLLEQNRELKEMLKRLLEIEGIVHESEKAKVEALLNKYPEI